MNFNINKPTDIFLDSNNTKYLSDAKPIHVFSDFNMYDNINSHLLEFPPHSIHSGTLTMEYIDILYVYEYEEYLKLIDYRNNYYNKNDRYGMLLGDEPSVYVKNFCGNMKITHQVYNRFKLNMVSYDNIQIIQDFEIPKNIIRNCKINNFIL